MNRIDLVAGQNCPLSTTGLHISLSHGPKPPNLSVDVSAFLLNAQGKVASDNDFVFFNQPIRHDQGVELDSGQNKFTLHLQRTSPDVQKIALVLTISDGLAKGQNVATLKNVTVLVKDFLTGLELACFSLDTASNQETALIAAELYRHQGHWKFRAIGQGFVGGLQPLAEFYGVDVSEGESAASPTPSVTPASKVNLSKVTLEKRGQSISLEKNQGGLGEILINLNWNAMPVKSTGFFKAASPGIDLDLACMWEFKDGSKGAVQALGGHFGNLQQFPFIELDQDDRSGQSVGGENLRLNGNYWQEFHRVLVFAFIYEGVPNWSHVDAVITIKGKNQPDIEVRLDSHRNDQYMCSIAMLENINNQLRITKLVDYFAGHQQMDVAYGWGLSYKAGSK
jgi:tellurite resistance protein TerA